MPDLLFELSPDGRIVRYRAGRTEDLYTSPERFLGRRMDEVLPEEPGRLLMAAHARILAGAKLAHVEYDLAVAGGQKSFDARLVPIDSGNTIIIARDVTEQRLAAEERRRLDRKMEEAQRLESIGVLAGGIAHDFNNLVAAIIGGAELIARHAPPGSALEPPLEIVREAAWRAAELSRELLAYAGKGRFEMRTVELGALVRDTARLLETVVAKGVRLELDLAATATAVHVDVSQLGQVVMNLVTNASDAYGGRPGTVAIRTRAAERLAAGEDAPSPLAELAIEDRGSGMDAATRERMFDPFFTTKGLGRGLGLASVIGIVRAHGGTIEVDSGLGRGTNVRVLLPASAGAPEALDHAASGEPITFDHGTVLVVDDERGVREVTAGILRAAGLKVLTAVDGPTALAMFAEHGRIDVALVDMTMPGLAGDETFAAIRRIDALAPVILTSAYDERDARERLADTSPPPQFLQKPVPTSALLAAIQRALAQRSR